MVNVYGKNLNKREFLQYFGNILQFASATPFIFNDGNATGVSAVEVKTGTGLNYIILPGRALDIANASYKGISLAWISKSGIVSPRYYDDEGLKWLRTFFGGLLTTCGLNYMGAPCIDNGEELGLHGRIGNAEAYDISIGNDWEDDELILSVSGKVKQGRLFGENLVMNRKIISIAGKNLIKLTTTVENLGFNPEPLMILFHLNYGYPLVSPDSKLFAPIIRVMPRDDEAAADNGVENFDKLHEPTLNYKEKVFFLELKSDDDYNTQILLYNEKLQFGIVERFNLKECPKFTMWKQMGENDYVLGLEPGTATPIGRDKVREKGELLFIEPGEIKEFYIEIEILEGMEKINIEKKKIDNY